MKLLLCRACYDVVKLRRAWRTCTCGESGGQYLEDGRYAEYSGRDAQIVAMDNNDFMRHRERGEWWLQHESKGDRVRKVER